jgi:uncharacterized protein
MINWVKQRPIISFFFLTFILSWAIGFPAVVFPKWPGILTFLMSFMPAIAAIIIVWVTAGSQQTTFLISSLKKWHVPWYWYAFALFLPAFTMFITIIVFNKTGILFIDNSFPFAHLNLSQLFFLFGIFLYQLVIVWGEELGWRGFALPAMQGKIHPLSASILLGLIWGLWHLPYFFMEGSAQENIPFWFFVLSAAGYSIIYSLIYNGTNESTWMASVFHAANNTTVSFTMMFVPQIIDYPFLTLVILFAFDLLFILLFGPTLRFNLNRKI